MPENISEIQGRGLTGDINISLKCLICDLILVKPSMCNDNQSTKLKVGMECTYGSPHFQLVHHESGDDSFYLATLV